MAAGEGQFPYVSVAEYEEKQWPLYQGQAQAAIEATGVRELVEALESVLLVTDGVPMFGFEAQARVNKSREALAKHGGVK
jgi:hypothetical protein